MGVHGSCWIRAAEDPGRSPKGGPAGRRELPQVPPTSSSLRPQPFAPPPTPLPAPGLLGDAAAKMALAASAAA